MVLGCLQKKILHAAYLWCNVVWSTTERLSKCARKNALLAHAKIGNFAMTISVKKYVIQFQISAKQSEQAASVTRLHAVQQLSD